MSALNEVIFFFFFFFILQSKTFCIFTYSKVFNQFFFWRFLRTEKWFSVLFICESFNIIKTFLHWCSFIKRNDMCLSGTFTYRNLYNKIVSWSCHHHCRCFLHLYFPALSKQFLKNPLVTRSLSHSLKTHTHTHSRTYIYIRRGWLVPVLFARNSAPFVFSYLAKTKSNEFGSIWISKLVSLL